jgi:hypothetical protein
MEPTRVKYITEQTKKLPVSKECDVLVCGGGPAGVCAAIAAARNKARTVLIERLGVPGGSLTQSLVMPLMTFHAASDKQIVKGIANEIVERVKALGGSPGHMLNPLGMSATITPVDPEILKFVIFQMLQEADVKLWLNTLAVSVVKKDNCLEGVIAENKAGRNVMEAKVILDTTGDADIAVQAGADFIYDRVADNLTQPMTLMFRMGNVDGKAVRQYIKENPREFVLSDEAKHKLDSLPILAISGFFSLVKRAQEAGKLGEFRDRVLYFDLPRAGEVAINMTRVLNLSGLSAEQIAEAQAEAFVQTMQVISFLKEYVPGFTNAYLMDTAAQIGVRETKHLVGRYTLTADDVMTGCDFPDAIARGVFCLDINTPEGENAKTEKMLPGTSYGIPFRCMLPYGIGNLLVAGRCISATREAIASARLSPTCMALGQAAGTAAALCVTQKINSSQLDVNELRKILVKQGAVV